MISVVLACAQQGSQRVLGPVCKCAAHDARCWSCLSQLCLLLQMAAALWALAWLGTMLRCGLVALCACALAAVQSVRLHYKVSMRMQMPPTDTQQFAAVVSPAIQETNSASNCPLKCCEIPVTQQCTCRFYCWELFSCLLCLLCAWCSHIACWSDKVFLMFCLAACGHCCCHVTWQPSHCLHCTAHLTMSSRGWPPASTTRHW